MVGLQFYIERSCYGSRSNPALSMPCFGIAKGKCGFLKMYDITRNISLTRCMIGIKMYINKDPINYIDLRIGLLLCIWQ